MPKVIIQTANLNNFDKVVNPIPQTVDFDFVAISDFDFPPITGLTPRLQYRIPKTHGWQFNPGFDIYIWLDGSMSLQHITSVQWLLEQLGDVDIAIFKHPWRNTIKEEVDHIEDHLQKDKTYITSRYKNGLHKEFLQEYGDGPLYASMVFTYRNTEKVRTALKYWWYLSTRYYTCDQVNLTEAIKDLNINVIQEDVFNNPYVSLVSRHK